MENKYLTVKQVAKGFEVHPNTIWRWVKAKKFPEPVVLNEQVTRWKASDIEAWEASKGAAQ